MARLQVRDQGIAVASDASSGRRSCCFPNVCVLPTGRWICGFRVGMDKTGMGPDQAAMLSFSDDQGRTWSTPTAPFVAPTLGGKQGRFRAAACTALGGSRVLVTLYWVDCSDPSRPFFNETTQGLLDSKLFTAISEDQGQTWSPLRQVDTTPYLQPTPITGPTLVLPDGRWGCFFELNKSYEDLRPWHHAPIITFTADEGQHWGGAVAVAEEPEDRVFYWDQRASVLPDQSLFNVFWTYDTVANLYLNIHATVSHDSGRSWSQPWDTGVPGQPAAVWPMWDGRLCLVYVDRSGTPCIKARLSSDCGRSFDPDSEIVIAQPQLSGQTRQKKVMEDAWAEMSDFSLGLPATAPLPGGDILAVYYTGPHRDTTSIHFCRLSLT